ncbi:MAG: SH3 domain-containing protein [Eubacterium sp.]|nr:SH3 domain-containing protein [Eubacterium sp.]
MIIEKQNRQLEKNVPQLLLKRMLPAALVMLMVLGTAVPAAAVPFTSVDGVISINLPNGNWSEIEDPDHWISLSNGSDLITIQHYANGEKMPEIPAAASPYVRTLSASVSTENEVFVAFAYLTDPNATYDIYEALASLRILQYDTKTAAAPAEDEEAADSEETTEDTASEETAETTDSGETAEAPRPVTASDFSVSPTELTLYVNVSEEDGAALNVRKGFSTRSDLLGKLDNGTAVEVIGVVQLRGEDYGWYKINYEGGTGYVSADYLTDAAPAYTEE